MDELSEDDKLTVARARKVQRFMSQPFTVAEVFTGTKGVFVSLEDTIKGFQEILSGKHDDLPEGAFYMVRRGQSLMMLLRISHCVEAASGMPCLGRICKSASQRLGLRELDLILHSNFNIKHETVRSRVFLLSTAYPQRNNVQGIRLWCNVLK